MRWSIRTKILVILSTLLLFVVSAHLILAEKILREDKELLVLETNRSNADQLANEIDSLLRRVIDKMELLADLIANKSTLPSFQKNTQLAESFFEKDPDLLAFQLIETRSKSETHTLGEFISKKKLNTTGITIQQIRDQTSPSLIQSNADQGILVENRSVANAILYLIQVPVKMNNMPFKSSSYSALAWVDGKSWQETLEDSQSLSLNFAVTSSGVVFSHPQLNWVLSRKNFKDLEILKQAFLHNFVLQQMEFDYEKNHYLGVYRKTSLGGLTVVSMMDKGIAQLASRLLLEKTIILSLLIVTIVLLVSLYFSGSLSTPLLKLVHATRQIAQGNFDAPIEVQTQDEIGVLASAFSQMTKELKSSRLLLEEYNRGLEIKVQERTQELEFKNAAIRNQQEIMIKSTRLAAVGEIAGQAAHEVLNPLTAMISNLEDLISRIQQLTQNSSAPIPVFSTILDHWENTCKSGGMSAWLEDMSRKSNHLPNKSMAEEDLGNLKLISTQLDAFAKKTHKDLETILRESYRVGRIVNRMRGLSRMSRIQTNLDIHSLVMDCVHVTEDLLARFNIKIETRFQAAQLYISADSDEMRQVFSNLIKNSMDAIQELRKSKGLAIKDSTEGLIQIRTLSVDNQIKVSIWDNGIGIAEDHKYKVFDANFSTKGVQGTGFGLSICRRFVHESGGTITLAASRPGEFTEFELTFPEASPNSNPSEENNTYANS